MRYYQGMARTKPAPAPKAKRQPRLSPSEIDRRDAADATLAILEGELAPYLKAVRANDRAVTLEKTISLTYVKLGMGD